MQITFGKVSPQVDLKALIPPVAHQRSLVAYWLKTLDGRETIS